MENKKLLCIVLPVYNPPISLLKDCIQSIIENSYQNFEVLLIIDYFNEDINNIVKEISSLDKRFKLFFNKDNKGCFYNYFGILEKANKNAQYFTILDSDDKIEKDYYSNSILQIEENNADLLEESIKYFNYKTGEIRFPRNEPNHFYIKGIFTRDLVNRCSKLYEFNTFVNCGSDLVIGAFLKEKANKIIQQDRKFTDAYIYTEFNDSQSVNALTKPLFYLQMRLLSCLKYITYYPEFTEDTKKDILYIQNSYNYNRIITKENVDELNNFINNYFNSTTNWNNTIPQIIHWSWISDDDLSIEIANNIRIWKERNSNWLIIKWNDSYFKNNPFVQSAIKAGKYATASDYIRLWALYNFGGIYLDSDCECIKSFDEELLSNKLLLGYEEGNYIAGHFLGAKLGHPIIKSVLDWYDDKIFDVSWLKQGPEPIEKNMPYTLPGLLTNLLRNEQLDIYPKDYFTAKNYATKETYVTENTYILHQYAASWLKDNSKKEFQINDFGFKN